MESSDEERYNEFRKMTPELEEVDLDSFKFLPQVRLNSITSLTFKQHAALMRFHDHVIQGKRYFIYENHQP